MLRAAVGGVCLGAGIAIGAYSGGWFLIVSVLLAVVGIVIVGTAATRSVGAAATGELVPVSVELIDRSGPDLALASTVVAGEARPHGDVPFRFHTRTDLTRSQIAGLVAGGRGDLPADALGEPGSTPDIEHRRARAQLPTVLTALAAMWATMLLPPADVWDLTGLTKHLPSTAVPAITADDPDTKPLWQWYDELLAHLRSEAPDLLDSLLEFDIRDSYVTATLYLGGDQVRVYEGRTRGWQKTESTTGLRSRDTFSINELQGFSAEDYLTKATVMLPADNNEPDRMAISRTDSIFGAERPVLIDGWFGNPSVTVMGKTDGTAAPWWPADNVSAGLAQAQAALEARGLSTSEPIVKTLELSSDRGGFWLSFFRGDDSYRTHASSGEFTDPDESMGNDTRSPRFRFTDVSPDVVAQVRDDAMRRYEVDPVDRGDAKITVGESDDGDQVVIEVDYTTVHGGTAVYSLSGEYLAG